MRDVRCALLGAFLTAAAWSAATQMPVAVVSGTALLFVLIPVVWAAVELGGRA